MYQMYQIEFVMARSVVGFAIGDIMGVPYEFKRRGTFRCDGLRASKLGDAHGILPLGSWSDDTSLLLCVLDALKGSDRKDIYERWRKNAIQWSWFGKFTNHGYRIPFDIGRSCRIGIDCMALHMQNKKANDIKSNGNGGLMRILPLAFVPFSDNEELLDAIRLFNSCSHNHLISHICCMVYILLAKNLIEKLPFELALQKAIESIPFEYRIPELSRIWSMDILTAPEDDIKSSGYVVDTLEASIWCCYQSSNFMDAILMAVNLGHDTDTVAAVTGGLSGIMYEDIPSEWIFKVRNLRALQDACNNLGSIQKKKFVF